MSQSKIKFAHFYDWLQTSDLKFWSDSLPQIITNKLDVSRWGDMPTWEKALSNLPSIAKTNYDLKNGVTIGTVEEITPNQQKILKENLMDLHPWRKGPIELFGLNINTEWRSDWKWDRIEPHIQPLDNRLVLDVGCGNGYHCWRMLGCGAKRVIGIDPSAKFIFQFSAIKKYAGLELPIDILPLGIEDMPEKMASFDSVFSMGVLYHRRSPMDHLRELRELLRPGGQLILETLVIEGGNGQSLVPEGRYAKMPNVWFLPSPETLISWLSKQGFVNAKIIDVTATSTQEQRRTDWMTFESLDNFLDSHDKSKTIEGHPAPIRAAVIAEAPF
jgi:tRNA (mo5U34)-methyltransferase